MSNKKRVVITGMGIVSSIGNNTQEVKNSLINQKSGIVKAEVYKEMGFRSQIHGEVKINLEDHIDKKQLEINIEKRVDYMVKNGLFQEVGNLIDKKKLNALNTVGYKEIFNFFNGDSTKQEAINLIKRNTKKYAKRQMTWFKKDLSYQWIENLDSSKSFNEINSIISKLKPN